MSIQSIIRVPQNDQQLDAVTASFNAAYGKYFDAAVSAKKSNNLRDCICEGLGFTNGAYQELQAYWDAQLGFDFANPEFMVAIVSERLGGYQCVVPKTIARGLIEFLCTSFPQDSEQLCTESTLPEGELFQSGDTYEDYGWEILHLDSEHQHVVELRKASGDWFPLYYGTMIIGFVFSKEEADIMNAMLRSASWSKELSINGKNTGMRQDLAVQIQWHEYTLQHLNKTKLLDGKYISLRRESMESSLLIKFDSVVIEETKIVVVDGSQTFDLPYNKEKDVVIYNGLEFDFISFYTNGEQALSLSRGKVNLGAWIFSNPMDNDINAIEWFAHDRIEYLSKDGDCDDMKTIDSLEGTAFLVK